MIDPIELRFTRRLLAGARVRRLDVADRAVVARRAYGLGGARRACPVRTESRRPHLRANAAEARSSTWGEVIGVGSTARARATSGTIRRDRGDATDVRSVRLAPTQETTVDDRARGMGAPRPRRARLARAPTPAGWAGVLPALPTACAELDPSQADQEHSRRRRS